MLFTGQKTKESNVPYVEVWTYSKKIGFLCLHCIKEPYNFNVGKSLLQWDVHILPQYLLLKILLLFLHNSKLFPAIFKWMCNILEIMGMIFRGKKSTFKVWRWSTGCICWNFYTYIQCFLGVSISYSLHADFPSLLPPTYVHRPSILISFLKTS